MAEEIAEQFGRAMKKGFISTLTLLVLEKEPMHGRQIKKAIEERTFGGWDPIADSTIYTILKNLREKNLIRPVKQEEDEKVIVYEITDTGRKTLDIMIKKEQEIRESLRSIITSTFGIKDEFPNIKKDFFRHSISSETEDIKILQFQRSFIKKRIEILNQKLLHIEQKISKLENRDK